MQIYTLTLFLFLYRGCVMFESLYSRMVLERLQCTFLNQSKRLSVLKLLFSRLLFGCIYKIIELSINYLLFMILQNSKKKIKIPLLIC